MGLVEFQLAQLPTAKVPTEIYLETWDKVPTGNMWTWAEIKSLMNNGFNWKLVSDELDFQKLPLTKVTDPEVIAFLDALMEEYGAETSSDEQCECPACKEFRSSVLCN